MRNKVLAVLALALIALSFNPVKSNPPGFIPMFFDSSDNESMLLNVNTISRLVPKEGHIEITFVDGKVYEIFEDYQEFKDRMRAALK
jgi:hypothetical protein